MSKVLIPTVENVTELELPSNALMHLPDSNSNILMQLLADPLVITY